MLPVAVVVENDVKGNKFIITLTQDGMPFDLTRASKVTFTCLKADGTAVVEEAAIVSAENGKISYTLHQQCLACPGAVRATIEVYSDDGTARVTSTQFVFEVRGQLNDGSAIPSQEAYPILQQLIIENQDAKAIVNNLLHCGAYNPDTTYQTRNIVEYQGASFMAKQQTKGNPPTDTNYWLLIAARGSNGADGQDGQDGADGSSFTVLGLYATLTALEAAHPTGQAGDAYAVGDEEGNTIYIWDINDENWKDIGAIKGGADGASAFQAAVIGGYIGTEGDFNNAMANMPEHENKVASDTVLGHIKIITWDGLGNEPEVENGALLVVVA